MNSPIAMFAVDVLNAETGISKTEKITMESNFLIIIDGKELKYKRLEIEKASSMSGAKGTLKIYTK